MRKAKKIEIIEANPENWYRDLVGCAFDIDTKAEENYYVSGDTKVEEAYSIVVGGASGWYLVEKRHVKVVEWTEASYREQQAEWIKKNDLKIGDKVRFMHHFNSNENGFLLYSCQGNFVFPLGTICTLDIIAKDYIGLKKTPHPMPYFAFEPITDMWRPCETVKEKLLFIGKKVRRKSDGAMKGMITGMYDNGFRLGSDGIIYIDSKEFLENYELLDGASIGVKCL